MTSHGPGPLVVAAADQAGLVRALAASRPLAGVVWRGGARPVPSGVVQFGNVAEALSRCRPSPLVVLVPYRGLAGDLAAAVGNGIACLCAGPPETSPARLAGLGQSSVAAAAPVQCGGLLCGLAAVRRLLELRQRPTFGEAVYLRWLAGGGRSPARAWWILREMVSCAAQAVGAPPGTIWVTATGNGRACQATATVRTDTGDMAQLTVCPQFLPGAGQMLLLGTGGLLEFDGEPSSRFVGQRGDVALRQPESGEASLWLSEFEANPPSPGLSVAPAWSDLRLLRGLRRSLASGAPQAVPA